MGQEVIGPKVRTTAKKGADYHTRPDSHQTKYSIFMEETLQRLSDLISEKTLITSKEVLTVSEAAQYLGVSRSYLYKLTMARKIPFSKPLGKLCFFSRADIEAWLMSNRVSTADELQNQAQAYCARTRTIFKIKKGGRNE